MATGGIVSICNRALLGIGNRTQISSIEPSDGSPSANACAILFTPTFETLARTAYWNCLRQQATLSLLAAAAGTPENPVGATMPLPPSPWLYSYALPSDCLQARFIVPTYPTTSTGAIPITTASVVARAWISNQGQIPFHVAYTTDGNNNPISIILCNQMAAQLVYTVNQPNPQIWDSQFQAAMVASLGAYLVPALALNMDLMKTQIQIADKIITEARIRDANEGSTVQDHIPDFIRARNGSGGWWDNGYAPYSGWGNMAWPG